MYFDPTKPTGVLAASAATARAVERGNRKENAQISNSKI